MEVAIVHDLEEDVGRVGAVAEIADLVDDEHVGMGAGGQGVAQAAAARIRVADVIAPFDRLEGPTRCLLGRRECSDRNPCTAHHRWKAAGAAATAFYRETSIADLLVEPGRKTRA